MSHTLESVYTLPDDTLIDYVNANGYNSNDYDSTTLRMVATILINNAGGLVIKDALYVAMDNFNKYYTTSGEELLNIARQNRLTVLPGSTVLDILRTLLYHENKPKLGQYDDDFIATYFNVSKERANNYRYSLVLSYEDERLKFDDVDDDAIDVFTDLITHNTSIKKLELKIPRYNNNEKLSSEGIRMLFDGLTRNNTLDSITFYEIHLNDEEGQYVANLINTKANIKQLNFRDGTITDGAIEHISEALKNNNTMTSIFFGASLTSRSGISLANMLAENRGLETFTLTGTFLDGASINYIFQRLENNHTLRKLTINHGRRRDEDLRGRIASDNVRNLVHLITHNDTLESLSFHDNLLNDDDIQKLADALKHDTKIKTLHLSNSGDTSKVTYIGAYYIIEMLQTNITLTDIVFDYKTVHEGTQRRIYELLEPEEMDIKIAEKEKERKSVGKYTKSSKKRK